jgi:predicted ATP-dependent serine protease
MGEENAMLKSDDNYAELDKQWQIRFDKLSQEKTQSENLLETENKRLIKKVDNAEKDKLAICDDIRKDNEYKQTISRNSLIETIARNKELETMLTQSVKKMKY